MTFPTQLYRGLFHKPWNKDPYEPTRILSWKVGSFFFFSWLSWKNQEKWPKMAMSLSTLTRATLAGGEASTNFFVQTTLGPKCSKLRSPYYFSNGLVQQPTTSFLEVIFWFPKWRSLNPGKGHLKLSKRSRTEEPGRFFFFLRFFSDRIAKVYCPRHGISFCSRRWILEMGGVGFLLSFMGI